MEIYITKKGIKNLLFVAYSPSLQEVTFLFDGVDSKVVTPYIEQASFDYMLKNIMKKENKYNKG